MFDSKEGTHVGRYIAQYIVVSCIPYSWSLLLPGRLPPLCACYCKTCCNNAQFFPFLTLSIKKKKLIIYYAPDLHFAFHWWEQIMVNLIFALRELFFGIILKNLLRVLVLVTLNSPWKSLVLSFPDLLASVFVLQCSTSWAMKTHTLRANQFIEFINPWEERKTVKIVRTVEYKWNECVTIVVET